MSSLDARLKRLETGDGFVVVRDCPRCGKLIVSADLERFKDAPDPCHLHRPAPPPRPGDITIQRSYGQSQ